MSVQERHRRERRARGQAILTAAAKVFAKHGLEGATIEMVAREAEVAVGTIYLYYSSRDDLYLNLIADRAEQLRARYLGIFARRLEPLDELKAIASAYLDYLRESREIFLSQHSVVYAQLHKRLKRQSELRNFQRVMDLSHEIFGLWEGYYQARVRRRGYRQFDGPEEDRRGGVGEYERRVHADGRRQFLSRCDRAQSRAFSG